MGLMNPKAAFYPQDMVVPGPLHSLVQIHTPVSKDFFHLYYGEVCTWG